MPDVGRTYPWCSEIELLLACARRDMAAADLARAAAAIDAGVQWPRVVEYAYAHGLLPLVARHAAALDVPGDTRAVLRARALRMARQRLRMTGELLAILRACAAAGIDAVPLKGPVLAERVYGDVALRHFRDIDILFHVRDIPAVSALLGARGYRVEGMPAAGRGALYNAHDIAAFSPEFHVELHYALMTPRGRAVQDLARLTPLLETRPFLGTSVRVLPAAIEHEYLCDHGASHAWSRLEWLATADALDTRVSTDLPRVRAARALGDQLLRAAPAPSGTRTARANAIVVHRLTREPGRALARGNEAYRYDWLTEPRAAARLHLAAMTFLYPAPYDLAELPAPLARSPLRVLARPIGLLVRWWRAWRSQGRGKLARRVDSETP